MLQTLDMTKKIEEGVESALESAAKPFCNDKRSRPRGQGSVKEGKEAW